MEDDHLNIGIIGVGGVGGYFGGKICRHADRDTKVFFIARGAHLDAIRQNGLFVSTASEGEWVSHPALATDKFDDLPTLDVVLLCIKSYDLANAVKQLAPKVSESTIIVPLLNGIDIYERIREHLQRGIVLPACVYVGTSISEYGKISQISAPGKILIGGEPGKPAPQSTSLFQLFNQSSIDYQWFENVYPEIWGKYIFIAAFGLVTACFDKTLGQIRDSKELSDYALAVMNEIYVISENLNVGLPANIVDDTYKKAGNFPHETRTSFQRDVESINKPDERDLFAGTILRLAKRLNVPAPVTAELLNILNQKKPVKD